MLLQAEARGAASRVASHCTLLQLTVATCRPVLQPSFPLRQFLLPCALLHAEARGGDDLALARRLMADMLNGLAVRAATN